MVDPYQKCIFLIFLRNINMTESRCPNEYDRNQWIWPQTDNDEPSLVELDWKSFSVIFNRSFSSLWCIINIFWFLVKFNGFRSCSTSACSSLSIFGHVQTSKVRWFSVIFKAAFGHIDSVMLISLFLFKLHD